MRVTEKLQEKNVSLFTDFHNPIDNISAEDIVTKIKSSEYQQKVESMRGWYAEGEEDKADALKKTLPAFTASGTFSKRSANNLVQYSGYIMLDFDDIDTELISVLKVTARSLPNTIMCLVSPSGTGLKIMVMVDSAEAYHKVAYLQVAEYYSSKLGIEFDRKTTDISRLCFFSWDPDIYYNASAEIFKVNVSGPQESTMEQVDVDKVIPLDDQTELFDRAVSYTENKTNFELGNRNNFIHRLSCNCNRCGVPVEATLKLAVEKYGDGMPIDEIRSTVKSVYRNNAHEFHKWRNFGLNKRESKDDTTAAEQNSNDSGPYLPDDVVSILPQEIQPIIELLSNKRERDVFVISLLSLLSGCLYEVSGGYSLDTYSPALFSFLVAPAASGKGAVRTAKDLFNVINDRIIERSEAAQGEYEAQLRAYEYAVMEGKKGLSRPEKPECLLLFIPGNSSSAAVYDHLKECGGIGIMCETEADALGQTLKNDWGGFSPVLRAAFHHEKLSLKRKGIRALEIENPKLAVVLSGTPSQVSNIIHSSEDGLFSRVIFYRYSTKPEWRSVKPPKGKEQLLKIKKEAAEYLANMIDYTNLVRPNIMFTDEQWDKLDMHFGAKLADLSCFYSEDFSATVKRLGLITFRLAMIFTAFQIFEEVTREVNVYCSDAHFDCAIKFADVVTQHAEVVFKTLPAAPMVQDKRLRKFYEVLPDSFERKDAIQIAKDNGIPGCARTFDNYLARLVDNKYLSKGAHNQYIKPGGEGSQEEALGKVG